MSDKATTVLMERDHLRDLLHATTFPDVSANTIPRVLVSHRFGLPEATADDDDDYTPVSPVAVLFVLGLLLAVFISIARL